MVLTGHIHKRAVSRIETDHEERSLHNTGAGTLRSADTGKFDHPQFNLIRLFDLSPDSNKFTKTAVYTFSYDGTKYRKDPYSNDGTKDYRIFDVKYFQ